MFNIAVVNIKDITKYLVSLTLLIFIVIGLTRYFSGANKNINLEQNIKNKINIAKTNTYLGCLNSTLPEMEEEGSTEDSTSNKNTQKMSEKILNVELAKQVTSEAESTQENPKQSENAGDTSTQEAENNQKQTDGNLGGKTEVVTPNPIDAKPTDSYGNVQIRNQTSYVLNEEMLTPNIDVNKSNIIIFHTHTCESYTPTEQNQYTATGTFRTTDLNYTVAKVGDELTNYLTNYGYNVAHDKTYHDYPAYTGSYTRSLKTVESVEKQTPADVVIDLHRDAIGSKSDYAPTVKIGDDYAAQLMFVIGTDGNGLWHPNWNQNLKFAVKVQQKAEEIYPGLFKPIILRNSRYNQHISKAATIIEVGATGNTLEQSMTSMKYLSQVLNEVLK